MTTSPVRPVIFLDFDGVLNSRAYRHNCPIGIYTGPGLSSLLDPAKVSLVQQICAAVGAGVVVSSSWRTTYTEGQLYALLADKGFDSPLLGKTTAKELMWDSKKNRAAQIKQWARENKITSWLALDDWRLDLPPRNYIQTNDETGLTEAQAKQAQWWEQEASKTKESTWTHVMLEEFAEVLEEAENGNTEALKKELVQCCAVLVQWLEDIELREQGK